MRETRVDKSALDRTVTQIFGRSPLRWERTPDGVATEVFRIFRGDQRFYLRLAEDETKTLAAEAAVHNELRRLGVTVPEVVHYDTFNQGLRRSVLVTTEIPGRPMASYGDGGVVSLDVPDADSLADIYREAGRDLALVNQISVDGFGWVQSDARGWPLHAEHRDYGRWAAGFDPLTVQQFGFSKAEAKQVKLTVTNDLRHAPSAGQGLLAHGDFDVSQVFHRNGKYTGIIDLGGIKGTNGWYDLATFRRFNFEQDIPEEAAIPHLDAGYAEVAQLPADYRARVSDTAIMIIADRLTRGYQKNGDNARRQSWFKNLSRHLHRLLREPDQ